MEDNKLPWLLVLILLNIFSLKNSDVCGGKNESKKVKNCT